MVLVSDSYEAAQEWGLPRSFTPSHGRLLDLCFQPHKMVGIPPLEHEDGSRLTANDLESMKQMVECDFAAQFRKELQSKSKRFDPSASLPHVYDVYLMDDARASNNELQIALCVPFRGSLHWWNGLPKEEGGNLWPLATGRSHVRRLTGLSGPARILQALDQTLTAPTPLSDSAMQRQQIVPPFPYDRYPFLDLLSNKARNELDFSHMHAVKGLRNLERGFYCIQSPPGCGKTRTMMEMILNASKQGKVIVTAPHNEAVAKLALQLLETGHVTYPDMVVFGSNCDESVYFLEPSKRSKRYKKFRQEHDRALRAVQEPTQEQPPWLLQHMLDDFVEWLHLHPNDWTVETLARVCHDIATDNDDSVTIEGRRVLRTLLGDASIVLCTLNSVGSLTLQSALEKKGFHTLFLYDGSLCHEAEFFVATAFPEIQRIVVMGDPKTQQPIVQTPASYQAGYGKSFLGQVLNVAPERVALLETQYRVDPAILQFSNERFYHDQLYSEPKLMQRLPHIQHPFLFVNTHGKGKEKKSKTSWRNKHEASVINRLLETDTDIQSLLRSAEDCNIVITSPYMAQVTLLRHVVKLPAGTNGKTNLTISTMTTLQDHEADIVIVSTVRTKEIGFADEAVPLNASLMRAKRVLRVVGDKEFFESLGDQSTLRALVAHAEASGSLIDAPINASDSNLVGSGSLPLLGRFTMMQCFSCGPVSNIMKVSKRDNDRLSERTNAQVDGIQHPMLLGSFAPIRWKALYPFWPHNRSAVFEKESARYTQFGENKGSALRSGKSETLSLLRQARRLRPFGAWGTILGIPTMMANPIQPSIIMLATWLGVTVGLGTTMNGMSNKEARILCRGK